MKRNEIISKYYDAWVKKDIELMKNVFSKNCVYVECFGEEYHGEEQILRWFSDWNQIGSILEWCPKNFYEDGNIVIVESFFRCITEKEFACDAISVIHFNEEDRITEVREYWSKLEHHFPYGK